MASRATRLAQPARPLKPSASTVNVPGKPAAKPAAPASVAAGATSAAAAPPAASAPAADPQPQSRRARTGFRPMNRDETTSKPEYSTRTQWQERVARPIATQYMNNAQINEFRAILDEAEQAPVEGAIGFKFIKILDRNDEEADTCILLQYYSTARTGPGGASVETPVFTLKMPIPENVRKTMNDNLRAAASKPPPRRRRPMLAADESSANASVNV